VKIDIDALMRAGLPYKQARSQIASGDLLFLHHDFVATWYGIQIEAVQRFTGPFAHVAVFDWIAIGGEPRLVVYESVVPHERCVLVSATAENGFFWVPLARPMSKAERESWWRELGTSPFLYSKEGAVAAGANMLPPDEDEHPRRWCAKAVALRRRQSGIELAAPRHADDPGRYVPTDMALAALATAPIHYVSMEEGDGS
jgi:hypothetical protein